MSPLPIISQLWERSLAEILPGYVRTGELRGGGLGGFREVAV